jgi:hypothetical protein
VPLPFCCFILDQRPRGKLDHQQAKAQIQMSKLAPCCSAQLLFGFQCIIWWPQIKFMVPLCIERHHIEFLCFDYVSGFSLGENAAKRHGEVESRHDDSALGVCDGALN